MTTWAGFTARYFPLLAVISNASGDVSSQRSRTESSLRTVAHFAANGTRMRAFSSWGATRTRLRLGGQKDAEEHGNQAHGQRARMIHRTLAFLGRVSFPSFEETETELGGGLFRDGSE